MGQRVNIQYSIAIEELEAEVRRLIERTDVRLTAALQDFGVPSTVLSLDMSQRIDALREELAQVDYCLNDVSKIIAGYVTYRTQDRVSAQESIPAPAQDWAQQLCDNGSQQEESEYSIPEAIKNFKDALSQNEEPP